MANPEQVARLKKDVMHWNSWRKSNPRVQIDLSGADLSAAFLGGANLTWSDLTEVDLTEANLTRARLSAAKLGGATFGFTVFGETDLSEAKDLDKCIHIGRSTLDHATLVRSGMLPLPFLRGCGLDEKYITYLRSLLNEATQFDSCFISFSTKDQDFADRLYADLQNKGVRCWFAPHDIAGGKKIHEQIDEAIQVHDRLLLILSNHSMKSNWVETEISKARKRELREARRMLFPLRLVEFQALQDWECLDADTGKDSAREIREYFIPDFSNWKDHDSYIKAFDRLLSDLQTTAGEPTSNS